MGRVLAPGPDTKLEITRSSSDRVKLSSQLEANAGMSPGRVVSRNITVPPALRTSTAAMLASGWEVAAIPSRAYTGEQPGRWKSRVMKMGYASA